MRCACACASLGRRRKHSIPWHKIKITGPVTNCGATAKPATGGGKCPIAHGGGGGGVAAAAAGGGKCPMAGFGGGAAAAATGSKCPMAGFGFGGAGAATAATAAAIKEVPAATKKAN